ncbi:unnamed protein product, partial [marine sediment metagenome]
MGGIGMKQCSLPTADATDIFNILNGANLLVGVLDGNQNGRICDGISKLVEIHKAVTIYIQIGYLEALLLKGSQGIEAREVLDSAREVLAAALGAAPGELIFTSGSTESS